MSNIIESIKAKRISSGLTQAEFGQKLGLPQSHVSKIEQELTDPRLSTVVEMVRVLDAELILVPRELIGAVLALVEGSSPQEPMWMTDEEEDDS